MAKNNIIDYKNSKLMDAAEGLGFMFASQGFNQKDVVIKTAGTLGLNTPLQKIALESFVETKMKMNSSLPQMAGEALLSVVDRQYHFKTLDQINPISSLGKDLNEAIQTNLQKCDEMVPAAAVQLEAKTSTLEQQAKVNNQVEINQFERKFEGTEISNSNKIAQSEPAKGHIKTNDHLPE